MGHNGWKFEPEGMGLQSRLVSIRTYTNQNACGSASAGFVISLKVMSVNFFIHWSWLTEISINIVHWTNFSSKSMVVPRSYDVIWKQFQFQSWPQVKRPQMRHPLTPKMNRTRVWLITGIFKVIHLFILFDSLSARSTLRLRPHPLLNFWAIKARQMSGFFPIKSISIIRQFELTFILQYSLPCSQRMNCPARRKFAIASQPHTPPASPNLPLRCLDSMSRASRTFRPTLPTNLILLLSLWLLQTLMIWTQRNRGSTFLSWTVNPRRKTFFATTGAIQ